MCTASNFKFLVLAAYEFPRPRFEGVVCFPSHDGIFLYVENRSYTTLSERNIDPEGFYNSFSRVAIDRVRDLGS
jgi:hypothetical protein